VTIRGHFNSDTISMDKLLIHMNRSACPGHADEVAKAKDMIGATVHNSCAAHIKTLCA
jgi:hypothetical protein